MSENNPIGYIVGGGLKENFRVRLTVPAQDVQEGAFVVIESGDWQYYGLVTDLLLGATDPRFADEQSETRLPPALAKALHGQTLYTNLEVLPALMLERGPEPGSPEYDRMAEVALGNGSQARVRSRPCLRITPRCVWPPRATSPRSSATRPTNPISSSAIRASRDIRSASTWTSSSSARRACSAPPARASRFSRGWCWPG